MEANPFFTRHARAYTTSSRQATGNDLARLVSLVDAQPGLRGVDIATGTGHTAIALAKAGVRTTGVDPTPAMLAEARAFAAGHELESMVDFVAGSAESIPFPDRYADLITCRRAAHHFSDVGLTLLEMARILRPKGLLGISDMCPKPSGAELVNRFERMRDPTHVRALDDGQWLEAVEAAGLHVRAVEITEESMSLEEWLRPVPADGPEAEAITSALAVLGPEEHQMVTGGTEGRWLKRRIILVAVK